MSLDDIKAMLSAAVAVDSDEDDDEPVYLDPTELDGLMADNIPKGLQIRVATERDGVEHLELDGYLMRGEKTPLIVEMSPSWYRKFWPLPLGMAQYLDLLRRSIETRQRTRGDVVLGHFDNEDEPWIHLHYTIWLATDDVARAYQEAKRIDAELFEAADATCSRVEEEVARTARMLSGWGALTTEQLIDQVERQATSDAKGRVLEELTCRLLETVPGFQVGGRVRTETEEIDVRIINGSEDPIWKRESALILAECKNWSGRCGKNEFVIFQEKLRNRHSRCSCGVLVSWNGFADTVTKEMIRGSTGEHVIVPVIGRDLRDAVREGGFLGVLSRAWERATMI